LAKRQRSLGRIYGRTIGDGANQEFSPVDAIENDFHHFEGSYSGAQSGVERSDNFTVKNVVF
jgi:hypothetical protein